jgi:hypothetical protein
MTNKNNILRILGKKNIFFMMFIFYILAFNRNKLLINLNNYLS